jgi:hypothetical protein
VAPVPPLVVLLLLGVLPLHANELRDGQDSRFGVLEGQPVDGVEILALVVEVHNVGDQDGPVPPAGGEVTRLVAVGLRPIVRPEEAVMTRTRTSPSS